MNMDCLIVRIDDETDFVKIVDNVVVDKRAKISRMKEVVSLPMVIIIILENHCSHGTVLTFQCGNIIPSLR